MASLKFKVTRKPAVLVAPSLPTPREILYLSNIDDQGTLRFYSTGVQFYRSDPSRKGEDPARVIREGLEKVLVWYYPYTGRLIDAPDGKLVVECTGEGVLFVEADADVALEEFGDLYPPFPCRDDLLNVPGSVTTNSPVLHIQVTRLRCGGFILATALNHTMSDAIGYVQFMQALSEMVKGAARPSVLPVWKREILRPRPNPAIKFPHYAYDQIDCKDGETVNMNNMAENSFFFGQKEIELLKRQAVEQGKCSSFDVLSALLWRLRTRSLQLPAEQEVRLIFAMDARAKFEPPLPGEKPGFFMIDYDLPKKAPRFQFMSSAKLAGKQLKLTYIHAQKANMTVLDGNLAFDPSNKVSAKYNFLSASGQLKYSYVHAGGGITFEPGYDFASNSWNFSMQKAYGEDTLKTSYEPSKNTLGVEWTRDSKIAGSFKVSASMNMNTQTKSPKLIAERTWNFEI